MNKKIKIIDLYNLIANEENLPQRIVYKGVIYNWDNSRYLHYEDKISNEEAFLEGICTEMVLNDYIEILNDEVLEENTEEIEELYIDMDKMLSRDNEEVKYATYTCFKLMIYKINELVKEINEIRKDKM